jgi:hypothetical protein
MSSKPSLQCSRHVEPLLVYQATSSIVNTRECQKWHLFNLIFYSKPTDIRHEKDPKSIKKYKCNMYQIHVINQLVVSCSLILILLNAYCKIEQGGHYHQLLYLIIIVCINLCIDYQYYVIMLGKSQFLRINKRIVYGFIKKLRYSLVNLNIINSHTSWLLTMPKYIFGNCLTTTL